MNVTHLGTRYGGWKIDLDSVPEGGTVLDVGVGTDISFALALYETRKVKVVFVDPGLDSEKLVYSAGLSQFVFIRAAVSKHSGVLPWYQRNGSGSLCAENVNVGRYVRQKVNCISFSSLVQTLNPCLIKLDIEGEEYAVYGDCYSVPQVAIEFHHRMMTKKTREDTENAVSGFISHGYKVIATGDHDEYTFLKV